MPRVVTVVLYQSRAKQPVGFRTTVTFNPSPWLKNPTWCCWVWIWCPACDSSCAVHCEIKRLFNAQHILLCSSSHLAAKSPPRAPEGHPNRLISGSVSRQRFFSSLKSFSSVPAAAPPPPSPSQALGSQTPLCTISRGDSETKTSLALLSLRTSEVGYGERTPAELPRAWLSRGCTQASRCCR